MKQNSEYWRKRLELLEQAEHKKATQYFYDLEKIYKQASYNCETEISKWYQRIAVNNQISYQEAKKLLNRDELDEFKWSIEDYIKHGEENKISNQWSKQLENASAKVHISRLEAMKVQMQHQVECVSGREVDGLSRLIESTYTDSYYRSMYEFQKFGVVGSSFSILDEKTIAKIISKPWTADNKTFSERIWGKHRPELISKLQNDLAYAFIRGDNPNELVAKIRKEFDVTKRQAENLALTESAFFREAGTKQAYNELGVNRYEINGTLDNVTCGVCQDMDGRVFETSDMVVGMNSPPFHCRCRCTSVPYFDDEFTQDETRAARDENGKYYTVPADMKYPEWKSKYVDERFTKGIKDDIIKANNEVIYNLEKLKKSGMAKEDYNEYLDIINNHENQDITKLYSKYGDGVDGIKLQPSRVSQYDPTANSISFKYSENNGNKYSTLAHEYGHYFDKRLVVDKLSFNEMENLREITGFKNYFTNIASQSDEFLTAVRKDKEHIRSIINSDVRNDLKYHDSSHGVQDAIDGLFPRSRINWGRGETYYNRRYAAIESYDKMVRGTKRKQLKQLYANMGFDVSNQNKVKAICRQYEAASEMWANIMSAEVCGGETLEYIKMYLPNSYKAMLEILKEVE